jgi:hypothetical protein
MSIPFRWNIAKREQLGRLVTDKPVVPDAQFVLELRLCASRIIAFASDADLIFIGRSPENLFDYLSGVLTITSWADRCTLVNISLRLNAQAGLRQSYPDAILSGRALLAAYGLSPVEIIERPRPVALIDLVASGETFGHLATVLVEWAREDHFDISALKRKLRFIGITRRTKTSPKTWRWQQQVEWTKHFSSQSIKNVSISPWLWNFWGNEQQKVTLSNPPWRWGADTLSQPNRDPDHLAALNFALYLYDYGNSAVERLSFVDCLTKMPAIRERWCRALLLELRQTV